MKLNLKNGIIAALAAFSLFMYIDSSKSRKSYEGAVNSLKKDSTYIRILQDKVISERYLVQLKSDELDIVSSEINDYKKRLDIEKVKNKRISTLLEGVMKSKGNGTVIINNITTDTTSIEKTKTKPNNKKSFLINDSYLSLNGIISNDSLDYSYTYADRVLFGVYEKRMGFFKPRQTTVVASLSNPKGVITNINSIEIIPKQPKLYLSLSGGYGMTNQGLSPFIGVSISKPLIPLIK